MSLVEKIKQLCSNRNITIAELERRTGISNGQIRKWDKVTPGIDKLEKVADYFDVSIDFLLGREVSETDDRSKLIAAHIDEDVTEEEMEDIIKYINFLKSKHDM